MHKKIDSTYLRFSIYKIFTKSNYLTACPSGYIFIVASKHVVAPSLHKIVSTGSSLSGLGALDSRSNVHNGETNRTTRCR